MPVVRLRKYPIKWFIEGEAMSKQNGVLGKRLKELRAEKSISQQELADKIFVAQQTVGGYEKMGNVPDIEILIRIARYFHVSVDYLIGAVDERTPITDISTHDLTASEAQHIENLRKLSPELQDVFKKASDEINKFADKKDK